MIAARTDDGRFGPFRFAVGSRPGRVAAGAAGFVNDPNAWLKDVKPFLIQSSSQFRSEGPLALTSRKYAREFDEVKAFGSAASIDAHAPTRRTWRRYWAENPPRTWSRVFRTLSAQQGLSLVDNARLFAMLYLTAADALITVWNDKAHYLFWRPITAIREAGTDGNPRHGRGRELAAADPDAAVSGALLGPRGLSGSFVATLQDFFGTDRIGWTDTNNGGLTRSFTRFSQAIDEVVDARVWSGIHFRNADEQGARIGRQVAKYRDRHFFEPTHPFGDDGGSIIGG